MTAPKLKIKKGDKVVVITGKDKGVKGEVLKVFPETSRVLVQGANMVVRHKKPSQVSPGGIEKQERSLHISNVALTDPKTGKPARVGYKFSKDGAKQRVARRSGEIIE